MLEADPFEAKPRLYFPRLSALGSVCRELIDTDACAPPALDKQLGESGLGVSVLEYKRSQSDVALRCSCNIINTLYPVPGLRYCSTFTGTWLERFHSG